jgi:hypothetical protein
MSEEEGPGYFDIFQRNIGIFNPDEQLKIKNSTVLIAGVGGVGGPSALILARMGIGHLILADPDVYSASNLNRQMPSRLQDIGGRKTDVVASYIRNIHPYMEVITVEEGITKKNVENLVERSDVVISSMDSCMTMVLQQALKKHKKMGLTASPMLDTVMATSFPPGGNYLSDIYPYDVDESDMESSNRMYYAWVEAMTKNKDMFRRGYFPVTSAGTALAAGLIGLHVTDYIARGERLFPAFPSTKVFDTKTMRMKTRHKSAHLLFMTFRILPFTKRLFIRRLKSQVEQKLAALG